MPEDEERAATKGDLDRLEDRLSSRLDRTDALIHKEIKDIEETQNYMRRRIQRNDSKLSRHAGLFWLVGLLLVILVGAVAKGGAGV